MKLEITLDNWIAHLEAEIYAFQALKSNSIPLVRTKAQKAAINSADSSDKEDITLFQALETLAHVPNTPRHVLKTKMQYPMSLPKKEITLKVTDQFQAIKHTIESLFQ
jgi:hypothetical protein